MRQARDHFAKTRQARDHHRARDLTLRRTSKMTCNPKMTSLHEPIPRQIGPNDVIHATYTNQKDSIHGLNLKQEEP